MTRAHFQSAIGALADVAATWYVPMSAAMDRAQINTALRQAHFLAQVGHESLSLGVLREMVPKGTMDRAAYFEKKYGNTTAVGKRLGNTEPGDGGKFYGRGPIQCTGRENYREFKFWASKELGRAVDCIANPDLLLDPELGSLFCASYWIGRNINRAADEDRLEEVTRKINGGLNGIEDRRARLVIAKQALQVPHVETRSA